MLVLIENSQMSTQVPGFAFLHHFVLTKSATAIISKGLKKLYRGVPSIQPEYEKVAGDFGLGVGFPLEHDRATDCLPFSWDVCMDDPTTQRSFALQAMWVIDAIGLLF